MANRKNRLKRGIDYLGKQILLHKKKLEKAVKEVRLDK